MVLAARAPKASSYPYASSCAHEAEHEHLAACAGHAHTSAKMDCALTVSDAYVLCGSEDGALHSCLSHLPSVCSA